MNTKIKNHRKIISAIVISLLSASFALAQPAGKQGPPPIPSDKQITKMVKELNKELDLNDTQEEEVSELYFAHFEEVELLQEGKQRPSRSEMEALDANLEKEVKAQLNEDQQKLYTAWLKDEEEQKSSQRPQGGRPQGGQGPPR